MAQLGGRRPGAKPRGPAGSPARPPRCGRPGSGTGRRAAPGAPRPGRSCGKRWRGVRRRLPGRPGRRRPGWLRPGRRSAARAGRCARPGWPPRPAWSALGTCRSARSRHPSVSSWRLAWDLAGRVARVATWCRRMSSTAVGSRPWAAANWARSSAAWAATWPARWENSARRASGTPGHLEPGPGRMAALPLLPADAEGTGQKVGQRAVVQLGQRGHRLVQGAGVERAPAAVGAAPGPGPGQQVVVELGVVGAAGPVAEADRHHAVARLLRPPRWCPTGSGTPRPRRRPAPLLRPGGGSRR